MRPRVSVVVATRNRAALLPRALDSVLGQTYSEWELIVVSDGSTDATSELLQAYRERDSRVHPVLRATTGGAPRARNQGIAHARGELVALLDDDAEWLPAKLERQLEAMRRTGSARVAYCPFERVALDGQSRSVRAGTKADGDLRAALLARAFIDTSSLLVETALLRSVGGFDDELPRLQDWDLVLRLAAVSSFAYVPEILVRSYETAGSISSRPDVLIAGCRHIAAKVEKQGPSGAEMAAFNRALGHALLIGGAPAEGRRFLRAAARLQPGSPVGAAMLLLSHLGAPAYGAVDRLRTRASSGR